MLPVKLPLVACIIALVFGITHQPAMGQKTLRLYGTVSTSKAPLSASMLPKLSVVGQTANARVNSSELQPLIGIDYIRLFGLYGTTVEVILPDQEIPVSKPVSIPIVVKCNTTMNGAESVKGWFSFSYRCEIIDLFDVSEKNMGNDLCLATVPFTVNVGEQDTIWLNGISKLAGSTSTSLTAARTAGIAEKGRTVISIKNGELRQTGHCVTDGNTRLVFSNVNLGVFPQPATTRVTVTMNSRAAHEGFLSCFDIHGNVISTADISKKAPGESRVEIDVSSLVNGTYTMQYLHEAGVSSVQLVVQR